MIKKKILVFLCLFFIFSCGKKADPEYETKKNDILISKI